MLTLQVAQLSERGGRRCNEDACGHRQLDRRLCCVLADGAGGHGGGDIASQLAVRELIARFGRAPTVDSAAIATLLRETNDALIAERLPGTPRADMHTTAVCLALDTADARAGWAHCGDSRLYRFRNRRLVGRTRDHSLVQTLVDVGLLAAAEMRDHPQRSELSSALGLAPESLAVAAGDGSDIEAGDAFLLCSDGLWECVDDAALEATLAAASAAGVWLDALDAAVRAATSRKPRHDNDSALAVWVDAAVP